MEKAKKIIFSNALAMSIQKMTLMELKVFRFVISQLEKSDEELMMVRVPVARLAEEIGANRCELYRKIREICQKLLKSLIQIEIEGGGWIDFQVASHARYYPASGSPTGTALIEIKLHEKLKDHLLGLNSGFISYQLSKMAQLGSKHSIRLFEVIHAQSYGFRKDEIVLEVEKLFSILGISKSSRNNFAEFKRTIFEPAKADIARVMGVNFKYLVHRRGRKPEKIIISFSDKKENGEEHNNLVRLDFKAKEQLDCPEDIKTFLDEIKFIGNIGSLLNAYSPDEIRGAIDFVKTKAQETRNTKHEIKNMAGFFKSVVEKRLFEHELKAKQAKQEKIRREEQEKALTKIQQKQNGEKDKFFQKTWEDLTSEDKKIVLSKVLSDKRAQAIIDLGMVVNLDSPGMLKFVRNSILVELGLCSLSEET